MDEIIGDRLILPSIINEDNQGAIFLSNNNQVGMRTKHIDTKYHYTKMLVENGDLLVKYVNTTNNYADIMTKNVSEKVFNALVPSIKAGNMMKP